MIKLKLMINDHIHELEIAPHEILADVLNKRLGLIGVRVSCGEGECGACTILMDGKPVLACMMLAMQAEGKEILTIEGLGTYDNLHPIQEAFVEEHGFQCGFCTPGVILSTKNLLETNPKSSPSEIAMSLSGHICRCGAYPKIIKSVQKAAQKMEDNHGEK
jgi:carbon-monoxide dehydrogenase small subunit